MKFDYYYGAQADQFSFVRIPKVMLLKSEFQQLSLPAKLLYGVLLDRMGLSMKNGWFDQKNRVYIIYQIADIHEDLGITKKKAIALLQELEAFGLIEKKRRGQGRPSILYVKSFMIRDNKMSDEERGSTIRRSAKNRNFDQRQGLKACDKEVARRAENGTSKEAEMELLEVPVLGVPINNNILHNGTLKNDIKSNHIKSNVGQRCDMNRCLEAENYTALIKRNISYDELMYDYDDEPELIEGFINLILEVVLCSSETIVIARNTYPTELVRSRFLKLTDAHIRYVIDEMNKNTTEVRNIRKYLLAALFNAPSTMLESNRAKMNYCNSEVI